MGFWLTLFFYIGAFLVTELLRPKPNIENAKPSGLGDFQRPTAQEGRAVPLVWGTVRVNGPNLIWFGDLKTDPITEKVKTGLFSSDRITVGYKYSIGIQFAICRGDFTEVDSTGTYSGIGRIWVDDEILRDPTGSPQPDNVSPEEGFLVDGTLNINAPQFFGEDSGGIVGSVGIYPGSDSQSASSYIQNVSGLDSTLIPAYRGTVIAEFEQVYIGNSATIRPFAFEVRRIPDGLELRNEVVSPESATPATGVAIINGRDANPMNVLYEVLTDPDWGLGLTNINTNSFVDAGITLFNEGHGYSRVLDRPLEAVDLIKEIEQFVDGFLYQNATTGQYEFRLTRESDYDLVSPIPEFNEDNILPDGLDFTRGTWADTSNVVQVEYNDPNKQYVTTYAQAQDNANRLIQGGVTRVTTSKFPGLFDGNLAARLASREIRALAYPLGKGTIKADRSHYSLLPGDLAKITWPPFELEDFFVRITRVQLGSLDSNEIIYSFTEDIFETPVATFVAPDGTLWTAPNSDPVDPVATRLWSLPLQYQDDGTFQQYGVLATRANGLQTGYEVHLAPGAGSPPGTADGDYDLYATTSEYTPSGLLVGDLPIPVSNQSPGDGIFSYNADVITIDATVDIDLVTDSTTVDHLVAGTPTNLVLIDDEIIFFESITNDGGGQYTLNNCHRGMLDTVPAPHDDNSRVWFFTYGMSVIDGNEPAVSGKVNAKILSVSVSGTQALADVSPLLLPVDNRYKGARPPLRLQFDSGNTPFQKPGIVLNQTFTLEMVQVENLLNDNREFTHEDVSVDPGDEDGYTYNLEIYNIGVSPRVLTYSDTFTPGSPGAQGTIPYDWTTTGGWRAGSPVGSAELYQFEVWTTKNGYDSQRWISNPIEPFIQSPQSPQPLPSPQSPQGVSPIPPSPQSPQDVSAGLSDWSALSAYSFTGDAWAVNLVSSIDAIWSGNGTDLLIASDGDDGIYLVDGLGATDFVATQDNNDSPVGTRLIDLSAIGDRPRGIAWAPDGLSILIADVNTDDFIHQFGPASPGSFTQAFEPINSADSLVKIASLNVPDGDRPATVEMSNDGTKLWYAGFSDDQNIKQFTLSTPYDISTATADSPHVVFNDTKKVTTLRVSPDGTKLWIMDGTGNAYDIVEYDLSTPYDLTTATASGTVLGTYASFDISPSAADQGWGTCQGFSVSNDGKVITVITYDTSNAADTHILQFTAASELPDITAVDWSTPDSTEDYSAISFGTGVVFNDDGTKMWIGDDSTGIAELALSSAWDVSTAVQQSPTRYLNSSIARSRGLKFNDDGTKFYSADYTNGRVYQWNLSTPYNVAEIDGAAADEQVVISQALGLAFSDGGSYLHAIGGTTGNVFRWSLSTPYDIGTATSDYSSSSSGIGRFDDMFMDNDGERVWILDSVDDEVRQYTLSTPHDLRSASTSLDSPGVGSVTTNDNPTGLFVDPEEKKVAVNYYTGSYIEMFSWT